MVIVKSLDDIQMPPLLDHIGWQLWQAAHTWKDRFDSAMVDEGYPWFREGRSRILGVMEFGGTPQAVLADRLGLSKQAVQQFIDQLVDEGYLERRADPDDGRNRIVHFTADGARLMSDANRVKKRIDKAYQRTLGPRGYAALSAALHTLNGT